jgi:CheY-like chemotaxis protein
LKILIVDDSPVVRTLIVSMVQPLATDICQCCDGAEALTAFQRQGSDLVLMDIRMRQVDGIQAIRQIRAAAPDAQIIVVTDYDDPHLRQAALDAGAGMYTLKENLPDLIRLLESM